MGSRSTTQSISSPWQPSHPLLQNVIDHTRGMGREGFAVDPYQGQRVANFSPQTSRGINSLFDAANGPVMSSAQNALTSNLNMEDTYRDFDTIRGTVADDVKANLASTFAGGGINSGLAQDTYSRAMTEALAGVEYGAYENAKRRQMSAIGMAPTIASAPSAMQLQAGGMIDDRNQRAIDASMARHYETENRDIDAINRYANLSAMLGGLGGTGTGTSRQPVSLGGIGSLASGIGGLVSVLSDKDAKTDIDKIGETGNGLGIYSYRYKGSPRTEIGLMAQEVQKKTKGAVTERPDGYLQVNYKKALEA